MTIHGAHEILLVGQLVHYSTDRNDVGVIIDDGMAATRDEHVEPYERLGTVPKRPVVLFFDREFGTEDVGSRGAGKRLTPIQRIASERLLRCALKAWRKYVYHDEFADEYRPVRHPVHGLPGGWRGNSVPLHQFRPRAPTQTDCVGRR